MRDYLNEPSSLLDDHIHIVLDAGDRSFRIAGSEQVAAANIQFLEIRVSTDGVEDIDVQRRTVGNAQLAHMRYCTLGTQQLEQGVRHLQLNQTIKQQTVTLLTLEFTTSLN